MGISTEPDNDRRSATTAWQRPARFDAVVVGDNFKDWLPVLDPSSEVWRGVPQIGAVRLEHDGWAGPVDPATLVLPLLERNIREMPGGWGLVPSPAVVETLSDKAGFARFVAHHGFDAHAPETYSLERPRFPCVLKRTNLYAGHGIGLVRSAAELGDYLGRPLWAGKPVVLQEYVEADREYTVNAVAVDGLLVWHCAYEYDVPADAPVRMPRPGEAVRPATLSARDRFVLQRFIAPLGYSGPLNIDFIRRPDDAMAVLEINPRLGGSLFKPFAAADLRAALTAIVCHARWHEPSSAFVDNRAA